MHDHAAVVDALIATLDAAVEDGLTATQGPLAAFAAHSIGQGIDVGRGLSEAAAIMHSVADVLSAGGDVSAALCFLLARNVRSVPVLIGVPAARVVAFR